MAEALDQWERAGAAAVARPAYKEAIAAFNAAIRLAREHGADGTRQRRELALQVQLGQALLAKLGYQAPATMAAFERALELAEQIGEPDLLIPAVYGLLAGRYIAVTRFCRTRRAPGRADEPRTGQRHALRGASHAGARAVPRQPL